MIEISKIFHFEAAHALLGYDGACRHIHGHSYRLIVTVSASASTRSYLPAPGLLFDFKALKKTVQEWVLDKLDHALILSTEYLNQHPHLAQAENIIEFPAEPSAENLLIYIRDSIKQAFPQDVQLERLQLYETETSFATWHHTSTENTKN